MENITVVSSQTVTIKRKLKSLAKSTVSFAFSRVLYKILPHGFDLYADIKRKLPDFNPRIIFDVGANVGQSAREFRSAFPRARIYSFEPFRRAYRELEKIALRLGGVVPEKMALGDAIRDARVRTQDSTVDNSLLWEIPPEESVGCREVEQVHVDTIDRFCSSDSDISHAGIDFQKIDTEGYDLKVLQGADELLRDGRITMIQVEAGMNCKNHKHVPLEALQCFLERRDYVLFGLYNQRTEWSGEPRLRFCNAVFVKENDVHAADARSLVNVKILQNSKN